MTYADRERYLREHIVQIAEDTFPDDTGLEWLIHRFDHDAHLTYVEVEPRPATVGYPRFTFVASFAAPESPTVLATYCLEGGRFSLLCTVPGLTEKLPRELRS